jgi:hypothetical protein
MAGDSFFVSDKKRKRSSGSNFNKEKKGKPTSSTAPKKRQERDEELSSGSEADVAELDNIDFTRDDVGLNATRYDSGEEEELNQNETAGEKRIRLAKGYLNKVRDEVANRVDDGTYDAADIDRELIAARLKQDVVSGRRIPPDMAKTQFSQTVGRAIWSDSPVPSAQTIPNRITLYHYQKALPSSFT